MDYRNNYYKNKNSSNNEQLQATSASDNGQTVSFQTIGGVNSMSKNADSFLDRNIDILIAYRKIRW